MPSPRKCGLAQWPSRGRAITSGDRLPLGGLPVFWLLISEIFPLAIRARGMSVATTANWLANLVVALTFLAMLTLLGRPCVFLIYAALAFGALLFAWGLVPETKGLSLDSLAALWTSRKVEVR